jgi:hydroxylamine reductase
LTKSKEEKHMFCYQCEQTAGGTGCTKYGVCGKDPDIASLQDTLIFALKGIAAYAYHARELGASDEQVDAFLAEALFSTLTNVNFDLESHINLLLKAGEINLRAMELLDKANVERFGVPEPTKVQVGMKPGPGILVTGHDFLDLYELLKQTEGKGINVYTHGEMLPALAYPELKKFPHLVGNYGTAWQNQKKEFAEFSGAILGTTNCVLIPSDSYKNRMFTCGIADLPGVAHIHNRDFTPVIGKALALPPLEEKTGPKTMTGFHHQPVLSIADKLIDAVKQGKIRHFFLVGGCDGARASRNYYTEFVEKLPQDCVVLTLGCGKFRFNYLDAGDIDGIPRVLDMGQCNNAYSAIQVAAALAKAFDCSLNDLPLSMVLSWFEQKAVAILMTLLYLGIKDIRLGPTLPAFLSPNVLKVLVDRYDIQPITTPETDIEAILGEKGNA